MTLPGDSLNHVHIRSEQELDFALPDVYVFLYVFLYVCVSVHLVCEWLQIQGDTLSLSSH